MENFNKRLLIIFENYNLNASTFADRIGVQRSSMSHILSGRNKPSLDFILKVYESFPEISLTWLTLGEGNFTTEITDRKPTLPSGDLFFSNRKEVLESSQINQEVKKDELEEINASQNEINKKFDNSNNPKNEIIPSKRETDSEIECIMFFYKDGTFKTFNSR